jgi:hypothetical protein
MIRNTAEMYRCTTIMKKILRLFCPRVKRWVPVAPVVLAVAGRWVTEALEAYVELAGCKTLGHSSKEGMEGLAEFFFSLNDKSIKDLQFIILQYRIKPIF